MAATTQQAAKSTNSKGGDTNGRVVRITGPVVDVEFPRGSVPQLFNALHAEVTYEDAREDADAGGGPAPRRQPGPHHLDAADRRTGPRCRGDRHRKCDFRAGRRRRQGPRVQRPGPLPGRARLRRRLRPLGDSPQAAAIRRAGTAHRDARDGPEGRRLADALRAWWKDRPVRRCGRGQDGSDPGDDQPYRPKLRRYFGIRRCRGAHP